MTGSGKTGLAVVLLEEALLAGIPTLVLDPKGDMTNLALVFPDLAAGELPALGERGGRAGRGRHGRRVRGEAGDRSGARGSRRTGSARSGSRRCATRPTSRSTRPGSTAGVPLNVVGSLDAPPLSWDTEAEALRDEIEGTVTSLLALVGIEADPLSSREHVLLSNLIENAWRAGRDLDLGTLIGEIQTPPIRKLGVFEIDQFFPPADRTKLAFTLNALVASPHVRRLGRGRAARPADAPLHGRREAALRGRLPRAPLRGGAAVRRHARLLEARHVDARAGGHARPARARVHGRGVRLRAAERGAAAEEADPHDLQAGPRVRARARALDAEPRRPRLQGDVERRHLARRAPPDRERQGARARGPPLRRRRTTDVAELDKAIGGLGKRQFLLVSAKSSTPRLLDDAVGDVVPPRAADEGAGRAG